MNSSRIFCRVALPATIVLAILLQGTALAGPWTITLRTNTTLSASSVSGISEMSGVTYLGPSGSNYRFAAAKDNGSGLVLFDVGFSANGSITSTAAVSNRSLDNDLDEDDYEGVAFTNAARNSVFVSEERTPDISEYNLTTGNLIQTVSLPDVFDHDNVRTNLGLESLTRSPAGDVMWTANEEALEVDGPESTNSVGSIVRLQRLNVSGNSVSAGAQYAYQIAPIHSPGNPDKSGLSDLVVLPDGSLITLERSRATSPTTNLNRIYRVDFSGATDISQSPWDDGLIGQSYTSVSKTLVWSGYVDGSSGLNMEGLALGPYLGNQSWALLGVVDNGGGTSNNYLISFQLSAVGCSPAGNYNCDVVVDEEDYDTWFAAYGKTEFSFADGNGDGRVSAADYTIWRDHLGATVSAGTSLPLSVPEPTSILLLVLLGIAPLLQRLPT